MEDLIKDLERTLKTREEEGWEEIPLWVVRDWLSSLKEVTGIE
jgi:hypothetical protein